MDRREDAATLRTVVGNAQHVEPATVLQVQGSKKKELSLREWFGEHWSSQATGMKGKRTDPDTPARDLCS